MASTFASPYNGGSVLMPRIKKYFDKSYNKATPKHIYKTKDHLKPDSSLSNPQFDMIDFQVSSKHDRFFIGSKPISLMVMNKNKSSATLGGAVRPITPNLGLRVSHKDCNKDEAIDSRDD
jgi:hypothetical protein